MAKRYNIKLKNGERTFSALSNYDSSDIFQKSKKWTRVVFLLHGFPDTKRSYDEIWSYLERDLSGKKDSLFICPSLRGYEPSSQGEESQYKVKDIAEDVRIWIKEIVPEEVPVDLLGHDWGAIASFKVASLWPDLVNSMVCLSIPYLTNIKPWELLWYCPWQLYYSSYMLTMQFAFLYRPRLSDNNLSYLRKIWNSWSPNWNFENQIDELKDLFSKPGVIDATTAYYRCMFNIWNYKENKWFVDFSKVPTLLLGGQEDGCMNYRLYDLEREKLKNTPNVQVKLLPKIGHFLHREDPKLVSSLVSEWFLHNSGTKTV